MGFPVESVEIGVPCSNPTIDLSVSGFGSGDSPPAIAYVGLTGSRAGLAGLGGWVGCQAWLDTPNCEHRQNKKHQPCYIFKAGILSSNIIVKKKKALGWDFLFFILFF